MTTQDDSVHRPDCGSEARNYALAIKTTSTNEFIEIKTGDLEQSIPDRFEKIVRLYPRRLALKAKDHSFTYEELNRAANRIARAILAKRGPGSEPVALLFEHGIDAILALFGVLKAGKFYVAINSTFPPARMNTILEDSGAGLIATNGGNTVLARSLTDGTRELLNIDEIDGSVSSENLGLSISADDLLTILYTSGSTGEPKGVCYKHKSITHGPPAFFPTRIDDRLSLIHSVSFGSAIPHLYQSLLNGASLFPFDLKSEGVQDLARWLSREEITMLHVPPAVFRQLAEAGSLQDKLSHLRLLRLSGAPITKLDFDLYKRNFCSTTLLEILMGSTETPGIARAVVDQTFAFPEKGTPAGYPYPGNKILLLDENRREIGPNQIGEIAVQSRYLPLGYWRKPDLTTAKFLPDPSGGEERIYLTGDLGRMVGDGFLIYLGRKDFQVKIRGYRVELAEIEKTLAAHPQVKEAGVVAWDRQPGEKYLVAYVVSHTQPAPTIDTLYDFLKRTLPDYMLPSAFMFLESLPLTNGKLDRTALPLPNHQRPNLAQPCDPPQDEVEKKILQIWEEVLDVRPVGIHDNFFDLGGHSLLAAKLFGRLDDEFGFLHSLSVLLAAPTVHLLAEHYRSSTKPYKIFPLVPLTAAGSLPPVYAVPGVFGNVVGLADLSRELGPQQPFYGLQSVGLDGAAPPLDSVEEMAKLYLSEIRKFQSHGPYAFIGVCFGAKVAYEMARRLLDAGQEVAFLGLLDPIALERYPASENWLDPPQVCKRAKALSSFVTERFRLYLQEMRGLDNGDRIQFVVNKIRSLGLNVRDGKAMRSVRREFHQLEVFKASKRAGKRYEPKPLQGHLRALEIFDTVRRNDIRTEDYIDWNALWKRKITRHPMPGKDSGDMVSGENARVLAPLLAERMRAAFINAR